MEGWVAEVFSGIQGEGSCVGCRHLFVRLAGCNLRCTYCDTPGAQEKVAMGRIEGDVGKRNFILVKNPVFSAALLDHLNRLKPAWHRAVSVTGGEPLIQPDFLEELLPSLKEAGAKIYLETNGTLPEAFAKVKDFVDITALDFKLASSTGFPAPWPEHARFLELAAQSSSVVVKTVVTAATCLQELKTAASLVRAVDPGITLVIQPVSLRTGVKDLLPPTREQVLAFQDCAMELLCDVRVIPQVHKILCQL